MENELKKFAAAILSDGDKSYSLYPGITIIGKEEGNGQHIQLHEEKIESRHTAIRISLAHGSISAEIMDLFTQIGTKIDNELIPTGEWKLLKSDNWINFAENSLKFTFIPAEDDSDVISCSPEPVARVRRRCRSMIQSTQTSPVELKTDFNFSRSDNQVLAGASQSIVKMSTLPDLTNGEAKDSKDDDEEVIPETQQTPCERSSLMHDEGSNDSELVFVESETQSKSDFIHSQLLQSQICPVGDVSFDVNVSRNDSKSIIIERSVDGSLNLHLDDTQNEKKHDDIPDIFKDTESLPDEIENREENIPTPDPENRDETVTPDLEEFDQGPETSNCSIAAPLSSVASTESKTSVEESEKELPNALITEDESTMDEIPTDEEGDIYNAATQKFSAKDALVEEEAHNDSDDDIFFATTQKLPSPLTRKIAKIEPESPECDPSIYDVATQRLDFSSDKHEEATSTRDDNVYDALTQVVSAGLMPNIPPETVDSDDSDFKSAETVIDKKTPIASPDNEVFFDSFSQLTTPSIFKGKLPNPISVKAEGESTPQKNENKSDRSPFSSPQANSTILIRKTFQKKSVPFGHLLDSPSQFFNPDEINTPDFLNLPPADVLEKQASALENKKKSERSYFFEDPIDTTETQSIEHDISENDSRTRAKNKPNITQNVQPKKERRFPKVKPPSMLPPSLSFDAKALLKTEIEPQKGTKSAESLPSSSLEPRKRAKPTRLTEDFVTESQMDNYDIEEPAPKTKKTSPLQEKAVKEKPATRNCKVVLKSVATVATALPESISPEMKPRISSRKRKAVSKILDNSSESEEEDKKVSPPKLRKVKTDTDAGNSSSDTLGKLKKTLTAPSRSKRGAKVTKETAEADVKIKTRRQDAPKHKILFTMLDSGPYEAKIKKAGHSLASSVQEATVLVSNKIYRSPKWLSALSRAIPIVSDAWLITSSKQLDTDLDKYLIHDSLSEDKYKFSLRGSLEAIKQNGAILKDFTVICTPSTRPNPEEVKQIVESSGGIYSDKIADLKKGEKCLVVADGSDKKFIRDAKKKDSKVKIVTVEAFMLTVLRNELVLDKKYLL